MAARSVVRELDLVFYWVTDLDRAVAFYRDVLGFRLVRQEGSAWAQFDVGGHRFALHAAGEGQAVTPGGATAVFSVTDLEEARAMLAEHGVPVVHQGDVQGFARFLSFLDPDGNTVQFIEYTRRPDEGSVGGGGEATSQGEAGGRGEVTGRSEAASRGHGPPSA